MPHLANAAGAAQAFLNPWAECWGSCSTTGRAPAQMQAESNSARMMQMQSTTEPEPCDESAATAPVSANGALQRVLPIINNKGLHARASAKFVQLVEGFDAEVKVTRCGETVGGQSIMGLMMLAAARGTTIAVEASGPQALACMDAIEALLADKFGEEA